MNTRNVKNAPSGGNQTRAKNTNNQFYCITIREDCKALKSFLEQEHIFKIVWDKYMDNNKETEGTAKADQCFTKALSQIEGEHLMNEIADLNLDCCIAYEYKGFYNGFRYALDFIFGKGTDEN